MSFRYSAHLRISTLSGFVLFSLSLLSFSSVQAADTAADGFRRLAADTSITRRESFSSFGVNNPLILGAAESVREIYLPVPANVALSDAAIDMKASFLRANGGQTTLLTSLDGFPVAARAFTLERGDAGASLGVDGTPRPGGFVRLGLNWRTLQGGARAPCGESGTPGNILRIEPTSTFSYRYDGAAIRDIGAAWRMLPAVAHILIASDTLSKESYDTAWRFGVALERADKHARIDNLPAVGDTVDLSGVTVPQELRAIPAFAALAGGAQHRLKDAAEVGALISLGQNGPFRADIVVMDKALAAQIDAALNALNAQILATAPDAGKAFADWRVRIAPAAAAADAPPLRLGNAFGRTAIIAAPIASSQTPKLFEQPWGGQATLRPVSFDAAYADAADLSVPLTALGGSTASFDVIQQGDWTVNFNIDRVSADGRLPKQLLLDLAAAPGATRTSPVASVFLNDILLGAKHLEASGRREQMLVRIPREALAIRNTLRVSFVRQKSSADCAEIPAGYPVAVLDGSHFELGKARLDNNFIGVARRFADQAEVMVPRKYLGEARATLPMVIAAASSAGVSPARATFAVTDGTRPAQPDGSFLAFDVPLTGAAGLTTVSADGSSVNNGRGRTLLKLSGQDALGILEVERAGTQAGIIYRTLTPGLPAPQTRFALSHGNFSAVNAGGSIREINKDNGADPNAFENDGLFSLNAIVWWAMPIATIIGLIALITVAGWIRRRRNAAAKAKKS